MSNKSFKFTSEKLKSISNYISKDKYNRFNVNISLTNQSIYLSYTNIYLSIYRVGI
jgi:hypothetical protein